MPPAASPHARWQEEHRYLNMTFIKQMPREKLKSTA
jgi:hypothetical protein